MRLLLVPYYFAPAGSPRSIRWSNLAHFLAREGHELVVVAADFPGDCPWMDTSLLELVDHPSIEIHRIPIAACSPGRPENIGWMRAAQAHLRERGLKGFDVAISSAMPIASHGVIAGLRNSLDAPWIADYGDPWSQSPSRPRSWPMRQFETFYERRLLRGADAVTLTTEGAVEAFLPVYPHQASIAVIPQGASAFHLEADWTKPPTPGGPLRVLYTGMFYSGAREPDALFEGLRGAEGVDLTIVGHSQMELAPRAEAAGVGNRVQVRPYADIREIVRMQQEAGLLLLMAWPEESQIPGKFWEYMATSRRILYSTHHPDDAIARMIRQRGAGYVVGPTATDIAAGFRQAVADFGQTEAFWREPDPTVGFDRRARAFIELIDRLRAGQA